MGFFQGLGFDKPERKGIPDFLQEVSGRADQKVGPLLPGMHALLVKVLLLVLGRPASTSSCCASMRHWPAGACSW